MSVTYEQAVEMFERYHKDMRRRLLDGCVVYVAPLPVELSPFYDPTPKLEDMNAVFHTMQFTFDDCCYISDWLCYSWWNVLQNGRIVGMIWR